MIRWRIDRHLSIIRVQCGCKGAHACATGTRAAARCQNRHHTRRGDRHAASGPVDRPRDGRNPARLRRRPCSPRCRRGWRRRRRSRPELLCRSVYYQDILKPNQELVWQRVDAATKLHYDGLRRFLLFGFGDAAGLENRKEADGSVYEQAQAAIALPAAGRLSPRAPTRPWCSWPSRWAARCCPATCTTPRRRPPAARWWPASGRMSTPGHCARWAAPARCRRKALPRRRDLHGLAHHRLQHPDLRRLAQGNGHQADRAADARLRVDQHLRPGRRAGLAAATAVAGLRGDGERPVDQCRAGHGQWILESWNPLSHLAYWGDPKVLEPLQGLLLRAASSA